MPECPECERCKCPFPSEFCQKFCSLHKMMAAERGYKSVGEESQNRIRKVVRNR